jgi:mono/diheme cytochrome c family protein
MRFLKENVATLCWLSVAYLISGSALAQNPAAELQFNRDIRPILADHCFACHGPDAAHREAELRLDVRDDAIAAGAIVPGDAGKSGLVARILSDKPDERMPPPEAKKDLSPAQREVLQKWIAQGAKYQKHWAYEPPQRAAIPQGAIGIDFLVRKRLAAVGLKSSPEADRRTLLRRLSLDLIGLPPSPQEVAAFESDLSVDAYEKVVDRLLASPHFGERMAVGWLDVVRFADTIGYHSDNPRNIWPYRDWVIASFNQNKPFDRFTLEQIAGDLLEDANQETRIGSAFNRLLLSTEEGGAQPKDYEARMLTDRVRAIGAAWLGQTTGCAQCHDHKFDPFTQRDFYTLGAFFADIQEASAGPRERGMLVLSDDTKEKLGEIDVAIAAAESGSEQQKKLQKERALFEGTLPTCLVSASSDKHRTVRILPRGNWMDESGEVVEPALPHYLPQEGYTGRKLTRLDLAKWLVSKENPLTARTVTNRLWKQFFGTGLSKVLDDLGAQGETPANPELLDWLACEFVDSGWNVKHMVKLIVMSETYRQSSNAMDELVTTDPANRELARQSPFRLDAELIRDQALRVSGLLDPSLGGPSVKPYQPPGYWENLNFPARDYTPDSGKAQYRRGLYSWWQRTFLHPSFLAFDAPSREECCADRTRSNIPQQALVLLNDPTYVEAAKGFAIRIATEPVDASRDQRIDWAWQQVLQRIPHDEEREVIAALYEKHKATYQADQEAAAKLLKTGQLAVPEKLDIVELAAWTHVARVLLNLHETITRP